MLATLVYFAWRKYKADGEKDWDYHIVGSHMYPYFFSHKLLVFILTIF
jgi:hypothetical protein